MTEYTRLMTPAERQRLATHLRPLLHQPELSEHNVYDGAKTTLKYHPAKATRRRRQRAQQSPSLECQENELGLICELVMAKGRNRVRARSSEHIFAALVVSAELDGSRHFAITVVEPNSKNLDMVLGEEAEITIVGIQPFAFLDLLSEVVDAAPQVRDSNLDAPISDVLGRRRPRTRAATSIWQFRDFLTLKGFVLRALTLLSLYVAYCRLEDGWQGVDDMLHYHRGRLPPSFWNNTGRHRTTRQYAVNMAKLMRRRHEFRLDDATHQERFASRELIDAILVSVLIDIPKLCLSTYVVVTLVIRGGTGPFYGTLWWEALYLAVNIFTYFAGIQIHSYTHTTASFFALIAEEMLLDASTVFYICLLRWNPADRTHTLRYLIRSLAASIVVSILLTAFVWSPILFQSAEPPRLSDLDKYAKRLPELRPNDMRNIPFITA